MVFRRTLWGSCSHSAATREPRCAKASEIVPTPANHSTTAEWSAASPHDKEDCGLLSLIVVAKKRALAEHKSEESPFCCTGPCSGTRAAETGIEQRCGRQPRGEEEGGPGRGESRPKVIPERSCV